MLGRLRTCDTKYPEVQRKMRIVLLQGSALEALVIVSYGMMKMRVVECVRLRPY
jgi:hypothetical protein